MKTIARRAILIALLLSSGLVAQSKGIPIGDIRVVYNAPNSFGIPANLDGPAFVIENFSAMAITNGVLGGNGDFFHVGTIAAGSFVVVEPGISNDGGSGHTFFAYTGSILDTSNVGPSGDGVQFSFTGFLGALHIGSGIFTPAATRGPTNDGTVPDMNFLGGPGNNDGPCNNCFGPRVVAELTPSSVPEQGSTFTLLFTSTLVVLFYFRRFATRST